MLKAKLKYLVTLRTAELSPNCRWEPNPQPALSTSCPPVSRWVLGIRGWRTGHPFYLPLPELPTQLTSECVK